jgi:hypothetical protein
LLVLFFSNSLTNAAETEGHGMKWVRSHPFTVNALVEFPVDVKKYKDAGFTSVMAYISKANPGYAQDMVGNTGLDWHWFCGNENMKDYQWVLQNVKELRAKYSGNIGLSIGDESTSKDYPKLSKLMDEVRKLAPDALVYHPVISMDGAACNMEAYSGNYDKYLDDAINILKPDVLMIDPYPFYREGTATNYFENLAVVREKALKAKIPYWMWTQSHGMSPAGPFQEPSESEMRFQAYTALAYGFTGISYWTFASSYKPYTNAMLDANGSPTHMYYSAVKLVPELKVLGERLKVMTSTGVYYQPGRIFVDNQWIFPQPQGTVRWTTKVDSRIKSLDVSDGVHGFLIGFFKNDAGEEYFMLVNTNHAAGKDAASTAAAVSIQFNYEVTKLERLNRQTGKVDLIPLCENRLNHYVLPGGTGELFKFPNGKSF